MGNFLNPSSRFECRQSQVGLCQVTAKLSADFRLSVGGCLGRPTLAGNVCVCDVAGWRSRGLSRETKRWLYKNTKI